MEVDYIIVGCGLAGIAFAEMCRQHNKSFVIYENDSQLSSTVAGGLYNPVMLKRFSRVWQIAEQIDMIDPFYGKLEELLRVRVDHKIPIRRLLHSTQEQNKWFEACDHPGVGEYLSEQIIKEIPEGVSAPFGMGEVKRSGRVAVGELISHYRSFLKAKDTIKFESFDYSVVMATNNGIGYRDVEAEYLIFAEGFGLKKNLFFNNLPLDGNKGELITIKAPALDLDFILKGPVFMIPLGNDLFKVGATYNRTDKSPDPTETAKHELIEKLNRFLKCDYEIVGSEAGIRPTVSDHRPLVGRHPDIPRMFILNGLGSRGVLIAPYASKQLFDHIENNKDLNPEMDIKRFD